MSIHMRFAILARQNSSEKSVTLINDYFLISILVVNWFRVDHVAANEKETVDVE